MAIIIESRGGDGKRTPMKCPMCESDNQDGSRFCSNCGGKLTASGVDYSRPSPAYMPTQDPLEEELERQMMDSGRGWVAARLAFLPVLILILGSFTIMMVYEGLRDRDGMALLAGAVFSSLLFVFLLMVPRYLRMLASSRDDGSEPLSSENADETVYTLTGLRPRR